MKTSKNLIIVALAFVCALTAWFSAASFNKTQADETVTSGEYQWTIERADGGKIDGSNYALYSVQVAYASAPMLTGGEEYWGVAIKNFGQSARVRFGFEMGGGACLWIGKADTKLYFVWNSGKVAEWTMTSGQYVDIPAYFNGTLYLKKTDAYGWTTDESAALVVNKYRAKGVRIGFDFRSEYKAKIAVCGVSVADITASDNGFTVENACLKVNFDQAVQPSAPLYQGTLTDEVKTAVAADFTCAKETASVPVEPEPEIEPAEEGLKAVVYERTDKTALSGSNYRQLSVTVEYANAPMLSAEGYVGLKIKNLLATETRLRYGFEMGGGVQCYMPGEGKVAYFVTVDGKISAYNTTNAQFVPVPANFDGTVYLNKADLYNWTNDKVVSNKYRAKGVVFGYDLRQEYAAKLAVTGITEANFEQTDDALVIKDEILRLNFDEATSAAAYLGNPADDVKAKMDEKVANRVVSVSLFGKTPSAITVTNLPRTDYVLGDVADYSLGRVALTYEEGEYSETVEYPLIDDMFEISGFNSLEPDDNCVITVKLGELTATFEVKIASSLVSGDDEEGDYLYIEKKGEINKYKTGWIYVQMAMPEWLAEGKNATGKGNCLGLRVENVNGGVAKIRLEIRSHNASDEAASATHRTGMWNNANAFAWFLEDGATQMTSVKFDKTSQYVTVPAGAKGTLYFAYDKDFSWKGHTAEYGMSHLALGFDMRSANSAKLIVKEVFDSYYTINEGAEYTDVADALDNGANTDTHFTTDVKIVNLKRFLNTKQLDLTDVVNVGQAESTMPDCKHSVMLLCSPNYAAWTTFSEPLMAQELEKITLGVYNPDDYEVTAISLKTLPKNQYTVGDLSDWSDGVVTVTYKSGRAEDVALTDARFMISGFSSLEPAEELTVTVSLADNAEIQTTFSVKVSPSKANSGNDKNSSADSCSSSLNASPIIMLALAAMVVYSVRKIRKRR